MNSRYSGRGNQIDFIRQTRGIETCRNYFNGYWKRCPKNAVKLLNDDTLSFASLFVLQPEIEELGLKQELNERCQATLDICERACNAKSASGTSSPLSLKSDAARSALLWIFHTGAADDGLSKTFNQILDVSASVLIRMHGEKSILPMVADLIFKRNREGSYNHDLIWAFFQARDAHALRFLAGYLRSPVQKDADLACQLLHLSEGTQSNRDRNKQCDAYLSWLSENSPYLYFTGESFQLTNSPTPCGVNLEAKYLCKSISPRSGEPLSPLTETEVNCLSQFEESKDEEKSILAKYSKSLHDEDPPYWNQWMQYPVSKQIHIAKLGRRELV